MCREQVDLPLRVVVLISGSGSNLQALIEHQKSHPEAITISAVISNRADAYGLQRAAKADIPHQCIEHKNFADRLSFDQSLAQAIDSFTPDLIVLAGFMRILSPQFTRKYAGRMINIHPSLLPKYQGLHTHQRALNEQDREHGCSIHFVTEELDGGPVIAQAVVPILAEDDADSLAARVQKQEHKLYPLCVQWFAEGRLILDEDKVVLDKQVLPKTGKKYTEL